MNRAVGRESRGETAETRAPRGSAERTPAQEAALQITSLVSGTGLQGERPDAQPASIVALAVPSCPPRTQRTFSGAPSSNLATFAPSAFDSSGDFLSSSHCVGLRAARSPIRGGVSVIAQNYPKEAEGCRKPTTCEAADFPVTAAKVEGC